MAVLIREQVSERRREEFLRLEDGRNLNITSANLVPIFLIVSYFVVTAYYHHSPSGSFLGICVSRHCVPEVSDVSISSPLAKGTS